MSDATRISVGWIGTGVMGAAMCAHQIEAGHPVTVHSRTRARAEPLYRELAALGHGRSGTQALVLALERLDQSGESDLYPPRK